MDIEYLLDLLPLELKNDKFLEKIRNIILNAFNCGEAKLHGIDINKNLSAKIGDIKGINFVDDFIIYFTYYFGDTIATFFVDYDGEDYFVKFEEDVNGKVSCIVLVKNQSSSIIEIKSYLVKDGYYESFSTEAHSYDKDYKELLADYNALNNVIFSDHFRIPENMAPYFRNNFSKYAKYLSEIKSEQEMRDRNSKLNYEDYFLFMPPFKLPTLRSYLLKMFKEATQKKVGGNITANFLPCLYRVDSIRNKLVELIGIDGEVVMSDVIYQNLIPSLAGYEAEGYDIKGYIIKVSGDKYFLYDVIIKTIEITAFGREITHEEAISLYNRNLQNKDIYGLEEFFGVNRGLI